jgi:ferredoxin
MTTLVCNCNRTMPLDGAALSRALGEHLDVHTTLCRREAAAFQRAARLPEALVVACTQEQPLFTELAEATEGAVPLQERPIRFVNLRETGGWSRQAAHAMPKMAALLAAARLPDPRNRFPRGALRKVRGRLLIIGPFARGGSDGRSVCVTCGRVTLLANRWGDGGQKPARPGAGRPRAEPDPGWLGGSSRCAGQRGQTPSHSTCARAAMHASRPARKAPLGWTTRSTWRAAAAIATAYGCARHRVPSTFSASPSRRKRRSTPCSTCVRHRRSPSTPSRRATCTCRPRWGAEQRVERLWWLRDAVGTFEKPRFFRYQQRLCAHARNEKVGCSACVEVCSASAVRGDVAHHRIVVEPHLCVGCGACTTVCPTGALTYAYPDATYQGRVFKTLLSTFRAAGGRDAVLLLHSQTAGQRLIEAWGRAAQLDRDVDGVPARVIPWALWHTASVGLELWLTAIAYGANQVWVLLTEEEAPQYREALQAQMAVARGHFCTGWATRESTSACGRRAMRAICRHARPSGSGASGAWRRGAGQLRGASRTSAPRWKLALEHLIAQAPAPIGAEIALPPNGGAAGHAAPRHRRLHAVHELRGGLPGGCAAGQSHRAAVTLHRKKLRAVRLVCQDLSRTGPAVAAPAVAGWAASAGPHPARAGAIPMCALRQALRHAQRGGDHDRAPGWSCDVSGRGRRNGCVCAATAG